MKSATIDYLIKETQEAIRESWERGDFLTMHEHIITYGSLRLYQEELEREEIQYQRSWYE